MMNTYILKYDNELYFKKGANGVRGFNQEELEEIKDKIKDKNFIVICIEKELEKFQLFRENKWELPEDVFHYQLWYEAFLDNNLNGFSLPINVKTNDDYKKYLKEILLKYVHYLKRPAFVLETDVFDYVTKECKMILEALDNLIDGNNQCAEKIIENILKLFIDDPFFVSDLDKSYSFRGIAPFFELQDSNYKDEYNDMMKKGLTFYRVRTKRKDDKCVISKKEDMYHLPYNLRENANSSRFSCFGVPSLYLGTTTYVCSNECEWNGKDEMYASIFLPNCRGKKLRILNLTISQGLINGIYDKSRDSDCSICHDLQNSMLKIFPLVIATSFSVEETNEKKYQYLLSQTLMKVANKNRIDGIAYLSMKGINEFQYPQGVNLAIPATDISNNNLYSEKCYFFTVSKPVMFCNQDSKEEKSYINEIYLEYDSNGIKNVISDIDTHEGRKFYGKTCYGKFDNYLVSTVKKVK